ncbi:hypothetical protein DFH09DRAFT_1095195 [Mycena vulgaris]|nr:hypothetical protein DFH09DRAFT_1095195 [Mycena vulgaris]
MSKRKSLPMDGRTKRRRGALERSFHLDSDDEDEPEQKAGPSGQISVDPPSQLTASRGPRLPGTTFVWDTNEAPSEAALASPALPAPSEASPNITAAPVTETFGPFSGKPKRFQGASRAISAVLPLMPAIQKGILATFTHWGVGLDCECGAKAVFRCVECFNAPMWCRPCIIREHRYNPFHHIEKWDGKIFRRTSLGKPGAAVEPDEEIKLTVQTDLKHGGCPCEKADPKNPKVREFTIGDHNGFHTVDIQFCECSTADPEKWKQLVAVQLFPATFKQPQTAFTFTAMKEFHTHTLASKKSAYDYVKALTKLTDNAHPRSIKDRYREFLFAQRIWRYLALRRRAGQDHGFDAHVPHRRAGSLTIRCPACPEVGFNISAETMQAATEMESHKFTLFVSADGNFKLQRKNKRDDPDDYALNGGNGYFVETEEYKEYLKVAKPVEDGTCSYLRAARMQNISKFKNTVISGVVALQCARHGFYLPQGMVDLKKGEAFTNTDYAVVFGLAEATHLRWIRLTYDIWCQYYVHLADRIEALFPSMRDICAKIRGAIPKMHIHNHIERCQMEWNLNWLSYVVFTIGEMIETGWAEHNLTAGSTKEMNDGHRHDVVDDTSNNWNWDKMIAIAASLVRLYRLAVAERRSRTANFEAVDSIQRNKVPEAVAKWEKMDVRPGMVNGKFCSVFQATFKNGPPMHAAAYEKLLKAELAAEANDLSSRDGDVGLIDYGLLAERDRAHLKRLKALSAGPDVVRAAQDAPLFFPSQFNETMRAEMRLEALAQVENALREGQAYDALSALRTAIRTYNFNLALKKDMIHGVGSNTRAQNFLKTLSNDIQEAGDAYRRARVALVALGLPADDETLKPLDPKKLHGKGGQAQRMGQARTPEPWFWTTVRPTGLSVEEEAEWETELDRVKWFRDRAIRDRAVEEEEALEAEFGRSIAWFQKKSSIWECIAEEGTEEEAGWRVYAYKQGAMYRGFAEHCVQQWGNVPALVAEDLRVEEEKQRLAAKAAAEKGEESDDYAEYYYEVVTMEGHIRGSTA